MIELSQHSQIESKTKQKQTGAHYTPTRLANFVAEKMLLAAKQIESDSIRILDPAIGDGELLLSLVQQLSQKQCIDINPIGFDTNASALLRNKNLQ